MTSDAPDRDLTASEAGAGNGDGGPRPDPSGPDSSAPDIVASGNTAAGQPAPPPLESTAGEPHVVDDGPHETAAGEQSVADDEPAPSPESTVGDPPVADDEPAPPSPESTVGDPPVADDEPAPSPESTVGDPPVADDEPASTVAETTVADPLDGDAVAPAPAATTTTPAADAEPPPPSPPDTTPVADGGRPRRPLPDWAKVVAGIAVLAFLGGAYWLGQRGASQPDAPATTATTAAPPEGDDPATATTATTEVDFELAEYEDPEGAFSFSYPAEWEFLELTGADPFVRLVLSAGGQDSFLVRVEPLEGEVVTDQQLIDFNAVTDSLISEVEGARVLQEQEIELSGLPGFYYLYQFTDSETGLEGAHVHYFLFQGSTMYVLVFQALPTANFEPLVPAFDVVTESFRVDDVPAPDDEGDTTTTAGGGEGDDEVTTTTAPPTTATG